MSVINTKVYRCTARDKSGVITYKVYAVAGTPMKAARTMNAWLKQNGKNHSACSELDCRLVMPSRSTPDPAVVLLEETSHES